MALEITELFIERLDSLCRKEHSQVYDLVEQLKQFKECLKGAEDGKANSDILEEWEKHLLRDIYSVEDMIQMLVSKTTPKNQILFIVRNRFQSKIKQLRDKLTKFAITINMNAAENHSGTDLSNPESEEAEIQVETQVGSIIKMPSNLKGFDSVTFGFISEEDDEGTDLSNPESEDPEIQDAQQISTKDKSSVETVGVTQVGVGPISEEVDVEDFQVSSSPFRETNPLDRRPSLRKFLTRNCTADKSLFTGDIDDHDDAATEQPDTSEEICQVTFTYMEEKSVTVVLEDLVNKVAQPVLNQRKLQSLMLKADVSCRGKSILLWTVYNSETVRQHFQFRAWINVSEMPREIDIVNAILKSHFKEKEEARQRLHDFLIWRRFLIVLYDVQAGFHWDNLKSAFPHSLNGSRVILAVPQPNVSKSISNTPSYLEEGSSVISLKAIINELTAAIMTPRRVLFLISIVGVVGLYETSLLWPMYDAEDVKLHFDCRAWVHVPQDFDQDDILAEILVQVTNTKMYKRLNRKLLQQRLYNFLSKKRYLVVLYDVWTAAIWDKLKVCFPNTLNGSRVILAVYSLDVARRTSSWIFSISPDKELLHHLNDVQENVSSGWPEKQWDILANVVDETADMIGLEDKVKELAQLALSDYNTPFLISVLGAAGSGKTTLVKSFYSAKKTKQHFECRAWINVPQDFDEGDILLHLFGQLRKAKEKQSLSVKQLRDGIRHFLTWKRYLIVLDDVRTSDIWKKLNLDFQNSSSSSKVILTTQNGYLARHIHARASVIQQRLLTDEESWKLFLKKVQISSAKEIEENDPTLLVFKEKILRKCGGLPFQIVVLGGLLSTKKNFDEWSNVIEQTSQKREKKNGVQNENQLKSSSQLVSLSNKPRNKKIKVDAPLSSLEGQKTALENQSTSLAQPAIKQQEENEIALVTEQATSAEDQSNSLLQQPRSEIQLEKEKGKMVVVNAIPGDHQEMSSSHMASSSNTKEDERSNTTDDCQPTSTAEMPSTDILAISYQDLPTHLKWCLLYLGLFPGSYDIPVRRLLLLWLAEELVMSNEKIPLEEAKGYFEELVNRGMIEITKQRLDGSPKRCCVPNALRDKLFQTAQNVGFFHFHSNSGKTHSVNFTVRRLAESVDMLIQDDTPEHCFRHLRSYICFYNKKGDAPTSGVNQLLRKMVERGFGVLVVLDLEGVYKPVLSETLGKLPFLKYLGLRRTLLDSIPDSVCDLPHIETLDVKHTYIITLPSTIWKAKRLQHLYMSEIYVDLSIQRPSASGSVNNLQTCVPIEKPLANESLNNLLTLWGLIIRGEIPERNWLQRVIGLRKLKLTCDVASIGVIADWLDKLENLQSLKLRSIDEFNEPADLNLADAVAKLKNLSELYLLGRLQKQVIDEGLPQNLKVLTLSVSHLQDDPMEKLGKLNELRVLKLYAYSFTGQKITCQMQEFPKLRILKLWMLKELQRWIVEDGAMPELKEVEIRCCKKLDKVEGLEKLPTMTDLILTNMEKSFADEINQKMGNKIAVTTLDLKLGPSWHVEENDAAQAS